MIMINTDLADVDVDPTGYEQVAIRPAVYYGALIKHEYDNQRVTTNNGIKIRHKTRDINSSKIVERFIKGVPIEQPLMLHRLLKEFRAINPRCARFQRTFLQLIEKYSLSCNDSMGYINHGMLLIDGAHINTVTDIPIRNVLKLDLNAKNWFEGFANLHIFIMY